MTRILVMGATGLMGYALFRAWNAQTDCEVLGTYWSQPRPGFIPLDIRDHAAVRAVVERCKPNVIALVSSNPAVDYCEEHQEETRALNVEASLAVVHLTREAGATLIFFSSDYVFDGLREPYAEDDPPYPLNEYGRQKLEVERAIIASLPDFLIIRVTGLYGWEFKGKNFVAQLIRATKAGRPARLPTDQVYNPTYAENAAAVIKELVAQGCRGVFHVVGRDRVSRYEFGLAAAEVFGLDRSLLVPTVEKELHRVAPRPLRSGLRTEKVGRLISTPLWGIREGLGHMKQTEEAWARQTVSSP